MRTQLFSTAATCFFKRTYTTRNAYYPKLKANIAPSEQHQHLYTYLLACLKQNEFQDIWQSIQGNSIINFAEPIQKRLFALNTYLQANHANHIQQLQIHLIKSLYDQANVIKTDDVTLEKGSKLIAYQKHPISILGCVSMHPGDLHHQGFLLTDMDPDQKIIISASEKATRATRIQLKFDHEGIMTILLVNPTVVKPIRIIEQLSKETFSPTIRL
jgi:hypothetical protein